MKCVSSTLGTVNSETDMSFKAKATELIEWAMTCGEGMEILPVWVMDTGRLTEKRPAYIKMAAPDDYVKNIRGDQPQDIYLVVKIPHAVHEKWANWSHQPEGIKRNTGNIIGDDPVVKDVEHE